MAAKPATVETTPDADATSSSQSSATSDTEHNVGDNDDVFQLPLQDRATESQGKRKTFRSTATDSPRILTRIPRRVRHFSPLQSRLFLLLSPAHVQASLCVFCSHHEKLFSNFIYFILRFLLLLPSQKGSSVRFLCGPPDFADRLPAWSGLLPPHGASRACNVNHWRRYTDTETWRTPPSRPGRKAVPTVSAGYLLISCNICVFHVLFLAGSRTVGNLHSRHPDWKPPRGRHRRVGSALVVSLVVACQVADVVMAIPTVEIYHLNTRRLRRCRTIHVRTGVAGPAALPCICSKLFPSTLTMVFRPRSWTFFFLRCFFDQNCERQYRRLAARLQDHYRPANFEDCPHWVRMVKNSRESREHWDDDAREDKERRKRHWKRQCFVGGDADGLWFEAWNVEHVRGHNFRVGPSFRV